MKSLTLNDAAAALLDGRVVVVPTDTVYGLAALLSSPSAIAGLFSAKQRPTSVALPVVVSSLEQAEELDVDFDDRSKTLAARWWPGPLTLIVPAGAELASSVGAVNSLGLRVPNNETLLSLLEVTGPLALTSANEHGQPPCTTVAEVMASFGDGEVAGVVDGGTCDGAVSSVLDVTTSPWRLAREGTLSMETLLA
jgi:tRNA threonylcarbamoyl adenosine modification protein (Sua5/YciO/YrdC/YwlC family)